MKKFGLFFVALLIVVSPAVGVIQQPSDGQTYQCWEFDSPTQIGIIGSGNNPYGTPAAIINDLSIGRDLEWTDNYGWFGSDFMIILDIPNSPDNGRDTYKLLTIEMYYVGDLATLWMMDPETRNFFTPVEDTLVSDEGEIWKYYKEQWRVEPNPRKELITIGLKGATAPAAIDRICVSTVCVPEPMTLALLAAGGFFALRKKRS